MTKVIPDIKAFLILIFFSLLIFFLDTVKLLDLPKRSFYYVTNPISFGIYNTNRNIGKQFHFIFQARFAAQENKALKQQIGKLLSENAELRKKLAETESLISQERHLDPGTYNLLPARPIGLGRYLKIDKGTASGIKVNQAVVFEDNFVGKVVAVSSASSNIELPTDPSSKVAAFSQNNEGRAKGVVVGQFGTEVLMDKILHEEKITEGDLVYSEGLEGFLPRGLILGRVTKVLERENEVFKQAKVQPVFDIRDLELVFVIQE
ncbi:rod shape-determining protein MreC [Candidatus Daviesbacteria bacterium]|nr:rod shape-determining protein MreC [Candidatus Daviesbacteria bacterium]